MCKAWISVLSLTAIVLFDGPRVGRPVSLVSLFVMNRHVAPVSRIPMSVSVALSEQESNPCPQC